MKTRPVKSIDSDLLIVGSDPTGALVAQRAAAQGLSVIVLDAGRRFGSSEPLANTEANAGKIMWSEPRKLVGSDFVVPKTGMGIGGGTLSWLGVMPRFHRADFRTHATEGVGAQRRQGMGSKSTETSISPSTKNLTP
jgi:choline dehydrogenase-like flavoprotein